jgi:hypothetical protein
LVPLGFGLGVIDQRRGVAPAALVGRLAATRQRMPTIPTHIGRLRRVKPNNRKVAPRRRLQAPITSNSLPHSIGVVLTV